MQVCVGGVGVGGLKMLQSRHSNAETLPPACKPEARPAFACCACLNEFEALRQGQVVGTEGLRLSTHLQAGGWGELGGQGWGSCRPGPPAPLAGRGGMVATAVQAAIKQLHGAQDTASMLPTRYPQRLCQRWTTPRHPLNSTNSRPIPCKPVPPTFFFTSWTRAV